ncbi:MAG: PEP-CTERM sorting domain-containing protein [Desulfobulbaceae bacterium]|nr:PEP-CTERM sorting domain-containing protein [Desulfobulbaceae bacterium]
MKKFLSFLCVVTLVLGTVGFAEAAIITFDDLLTGVTSYGFDGDGDLINDVIFSTTDPSGYNTVGPGSNMTYIDEPGLEGSTVYDLRVDFLNQAESYLNFGFALDDDSETINTWVDFSVYDAGGNLLASDFEYGLYTLPDGTNRSNFPEGRIETTFSGIASYALFDSNNDSSGGQRYIFDNFEGIFGSTEVPPQNPIPEPSTILLMGAGLLGLVGYNRKRFSKKS